MNNANTSGKSLDLVEKSRKARLLIIEVAKRVSGAHIGGSFSIIDFLIAYYSFICPDDDEKRVAFYQGMLENIPTLVFSKGHCYLAQLAALDIISSETYYTSNYLKEGSEFFGHPKRLVANSHFPVSTGALGQGITFANGLALGNKIYKNDEVVISILGDGEMNEGSCSEALLFAKQHELNHLVVIDNNRQISLGKTNDILNLGNLNERMMNFGFEGDVVDGHDFEMLNTQILKNFKSKGPRYLILNTVKGNGVSFMKGEFKWHHRRFKDNEYEEALNELKNKENL